MTNALDLRGTHLFPVIKKHFELTSINALTYPLVDVAKVRAEMGERIRQTVKEFMSSGATGSGGLCVEVGDMLRGVPKEHRIALYESAKEFGGF